MNILLLYPEFPDTFWSFKHALSFVGKKASFPPLGLLTVAGLLPKEWQKKLVDLNVRKLHSRDLEWADYVFISGMLVQRQSAQRAIDRCREAGVKVVAGGPLFTAEHDSFHGVDHFVLNEAEITLPAFLEDLKNNKTKKLYTTDRHVDIKNTPTPLWSLVRMKDYYSMVLQYSRGCPFACDFCNVTALFGRRVRTKSSQQILTELDALYAQGWRGNIFFVDDNFIGNKHHLKNDLLPRLIAWRKDKKTVIFHTEASINLADDKDLMHLMTQAGFDMVFVGIETPDEDALEECSKKQNRNRDLVADVKRIQRAGLQVQGGFIVGFDSDKVSVFQKQIRFIQESGIVTAMVGLLQAPKGTMLYQRLKEQGRVLGSGTGDNMEGTTNIVTLMDLEKLQQGYREILNHIYAPRHYYTRIKTFLREYRPSKISFDLKHTDVIAFFRSVYKLGILGRERLQYWNLLAWTFLKRPILFPLAVNLAISGYHFKKICELHIRQ